MATLIVMQADITKLEVDAIVNAAHMALMGGGGVDGAIHRSAGPKLLQACREISETSPGVRCPVGSACITPGFRLPAKYVIHTVAPKFVGSKQTGPMEDLYKNVYPETEEDLARCYVSCLDLAQENGCKSVAFPSLGTGGHAWPIEVAAPIAVKATSGWMKSGTIDNVYLVAFSDYDFKVYSKVMHQGEKQ